ncbi:hypothetical protein [Holophaga foetida]|uniref:DUF7768 domain-containing protein n=1 Tax=Holophaga foetida TaxID=35839 RepID=UPI0002473347|nr:hypothetical protein [Holophaga foetida]
MEHLAWRLGLDHDTLHRAAADAELTLRLLDDLDGWGNVRTTLGDRNILIYLAVPLRGNGNAEAIRYNQELMFRQARWGQAILPQATFVVLHANFAFLNESQDRDGNVRQLALTGCERLLTRCEAMILCGRELSPGMAQEKRLADRLGIPSLRVPVGYAEDIRDRRRCCMKEQSLVVPDHKGSRILPPGELGVI